MCTDYCSIREGERLLTRLCESPGGQGVIRWEEPEEAVTIILATELFEEQP